MPIIKQAKKRVKQAAVRQKRNYNMRTALRKAIRSINDAVKTGDKKTAESLMPQAQKVIDTAAKKNILHKKTAARRKASLVKAIKGIDAK